MSAIAAKRIPKYLPPKEQGAAAWTAAQLGSNAVVGWVREYRLQAAVGALTLAAMCWAISLVATKALLTSFPPLTLLFVQLTASMCVLWVAVAAFGKPVRPDRSLALAGLTGVVEPGLVYVIEIFGLALTSASHAALIGALEPVLIVLLAMWWLRERVSAKTITVAAAGCVGLAMVVEPPGAGARFVGDALILVSTLLAAFYVVFTRHLLLRMSALNLVTAQQTAAWLFSLLALFVVVATGIHPLGLDGFTARSLIGAALTGVLQFAVPFWLYLWALERVGASGTGPYVALVPVFAIAGGCLALGETMTSLQWIGAIVIVYAISRFKPAEEKRRNRRHTDPLAN